jgi:hypothetical protein
VVELSILEVSVDKELSILALEQLVPCFGEAQTLLQTAVIGQYYDVDQNQRHVLLDIGEQDVELSLKAVVLSWDVPDTGFFKSYDVLALLHQDFDQFFVVFVLPHTYLEQKLGDLEGDSVGEVALSDVSPCHVREEIFEEAVHEFLQIEVFAEILLLDITIGLAFFPDIYPCQRVDNFDVFAIDFPLKFEICL